MELEAGPPPSSMWGVVRLGWGVRLSVTSEESLPGRKEDKGGGAQPRRKQSGTLP